LTPPFELAPIGQTVGARSSLALPYLRSSRLRRGGGVATALPGPRGRTTAMEGVRAPSPLPANVSLVPPVTAPTSADGDGQAPCTTHSAVTQQQRRQRRRVSMDELWAAEAEWETQVAKPRSADTTQVAKSSHTVTVRRRARTHTVTLCEFTELTVTLVFLNKYTCDYESLIS
jgi:hypothetical protein